MMKPKFLILTGSGGLIDNGREDTLDPTNIGLDSKVIQCRRGQMIKDVIIDTVYVINL
jgi:hypothetical protein